MSHLYTSQGIRSARSTRSEEVAYQRNFPHFDLSSRAVKLPPIIKNELLVGRGGQTSLQPCQTSSSLTARPSKANQLNTSFPKIAEPQPQRKWSGTTSRHNNQAQIKHVEKTPIRFPNSYTVLPPIGKTSSWQAQNGFSTLRASPKNGEQAPISVQDQLKGRRRTSQRKRSDNGPSPSPTVVEKERINPRNCPGSARNNENINNAIENRNQNRKQAACTSYTSIARSEGDTISDKTLPGLSDEDIQVTECDSTRHELEKLELSKEAKEFLESEHSKRRNATCIETDPSLKKAVDVIRDNLLRQTMEELCMMW